jgi:hypothetical protein
VPVSLALCKFFKCCTKPEALIFKGFRCAEIINEME